MLQFKYKILEAFGIPVYVNLSFLFLLAVFMFDFGSFSLGLSMALVLAISITLHELAHALAARAFGYPTRDITLSLLGGCASLSAMPRKAWQELLVALAGPLMSFALAGAVLLLDVFGVPVVNPWLRATLLYCCWMNLVLGGFNLLPGFPMDGGRVFRSVMRAFMSRAQATYVAMVVGRVFAVLLGLYGLWSVFGRGSGSWITLFIAWMVWQEGYREYLQVRAEEDFRRWSQDDFNARVSPPPYGR